MKYARMMLVLGVLVAIAVASSGCGAGASIRESVPAPRLSAPFLPVLDSAPEESEPKVALGSYAPDFALSNLQGESVTLSEYRGQTVLLNFWASWCAPCREEIPLLEATYETYGQSGLVVLSVNMGEDERRVGAFVEDLDISFPVFVDEDTVIGAQYRVRGAPTTYFIDGDGIIRQRYVGALSAGALVDIMSGRDAYPN